MDIFSIIKSLERTSNIKYVKFVAENSGNTCAQCRKHHNSIFRADDPSKPQLPIHPHCRCQYEPLNDTLISKIGERIKQTADEINQYAQRVYQDASDTVTGTKILLDEMIKDKCGDIKKLSSKISSQIILIQGQLQNMQEIYSTATQLCKIADTIGIKPEQGAIILLSVESAVLIGELKRLHYLRLLEPDQQIENLPTSPAEAIKRGFTKAQNSQNRYHRNKGQLDNEKYIHSITGQEVIFDKQGQIVRQCNEFSVKSRGPKA